MFELYVSVEAVIDGVHRAEDTVVVDVMAVVSDFKAKGGKEITVRVTVKVDGEIRYWSFSDGEEAVLMCAMK